MSANATEIPDGEELNLFKRFMPSQQAEKEQEDAPERASKQQRTKEIVQKGGADATARARDPVGALSSQPFVPGALRTSSRASAIKTCSFFVRC